MPLEGFDEIPMREADASRLRRGQAVILRGRDAPLPSETAVATEGGRLVAIGRIAEGAFHPTRVFAAH
jgi:tRNA pseudouridine55 synthase